MSHPHSSGSQETTSRPIDRPEIDLVDLLRYLWADKVIIVAVTCITLIGAALYAFGVAPVYESEGLYTPPAQQQVLQIYPLPIKDFEFDKELAFAEFKAKVLSNQVQSRFFREKVWSGTGDASALQDRFYRDYQDFVRQLRMDVPGAQETDKFIGVRYEGEDPVAAAELVRKYISFANAAALSQLAENFHAFKAGAEAKLVSEIESLKFVAEQKRVQRIEKLQSALGIAKNLGIQENKIGQTTTAGVASADEEKRAGINLVEPPLYLYGTQELTAQIAALKASKGSYFDVPRLPELEGELAQLRKVAFYPDRGVVYTEQNEPMPKYTPVKPRKSLILALAGVGGLILGVFISLLRTAFRRSLKPV